MKQNSKLASVRRLAARQQGTLVPGLPFLELCRRYSSRPVLFAEITVWLGCKRPLIRRSGTRPGAGVPNSEESKSK